MELRASQYTVQQYCDLMERGTVVINREYQRHPTVWPSIARSFLIESILLGFPIPKMSLYPTTDLKTLRTRMEIVDGQQRSRAIKDFFDGRLRISQKSEMAQAAGRPFGELDEGLQLKFIEYPLTFDLFVSATPFDIREAFRRINAYTTPLNDEEQRHARFQGSFKWFVFEFCAHIDPPLVRLGVLKERQIARMQDAKLITEICHALIHGIKTTKKQQLDALYKEFDTEFPAGEGITKRFDLAISQILAFENLAGSAMMKPHVFYALFLAVTHAQRNVPALSEVFRFKNGFRIDAFRAAESLGRLAAALDDESDDNPFREFFQASAEKTNVDTQRIVRFRWCCQALLGRLG